MAKSFLDNKLIFKNNTATLLYQAMQINKFYGFGILAAIAQKGFIDATLEL